MVFDSNAEDFQGKGQTLKRVDSEVRNRRFNIGDGWAMPMKAELTNWRNLAEMPTSGSTLLAGSGRDTSELVSACVKAR